MFRWPDREQVLSAARAWALSLCQRDAVVESVFCVGSYARGDWGVGSDLDIVVVIRDSQLSPVRRYAHYEPQGLPVPADLWVYTRAEWEELSRQAPHLWRRLQNEMLDLREDNAA